MIPSSNVAEDEKIQQTVLEIAAKGEFDKADEVTRDYVRQIYLREVRYWSLDRKIRFIDLVTGGLGYRELDVTDFDRITHVGTYIAWPDAVRENTYIFEIGTGLGRTLYVVTSRHSVKLYLTCDVNPYILAIALFENPISEFQEALWRSNVKILLCDAIRLSFRLQLKFNHIIHDGGPCPDSNPRLYSQHLLRRILDLCERGGTISMFAGRNRRWVERIYNFFKSQPDVEQVVTISVPGSTVKVIHVKKK